LFLRITAFRVFVLADVFGRFFDLLLFSKDRKKKKSDLISEIQQVLNRNLVRDLNVKNYQSLEMPSNGTKANLGGRIPQPNHSKNYNARSQIRWIDPTRYIHIPQVYR